MDTKNDDSAGSDSLDKSLQKKCVVDDVGQGEGPLALAQGTTSDSGAKKSARSEVDVQPENSTKNQKTEKSVGDGGSEGGANYVKEIADTTNKAKAQKTPNENSTCAAAVAETNSTENIPNSTTHTATSLSSTTMPSSSNSNAFETKVKQISKNLKETTLAESANNIKKTSLEDSNSTSSTSSSSTSTPESEQVAAPLLSSASCSDPNATPSCGQTVDLDSSQLSVNDSIDEHDHRSKKVRFHPDVKENDGGNRVIPKKKKKLKASTSGDDGAASSQRTGSAEDDMELDEEEEEAEEEEDFDLAKTIAEAQDYLKTHPLTFVRPYDKNSAPLQNGLLEEEDLSQLSESSEEEDIYENVQPENGIERILGKQVKCGKVEFLLRYSDRPGLGWEPEDIITKQCPNLLNKYEQHREQRQERLMRHVSKRQNIRQRYTDF